MFILKLLDRGIMTKETALTDADIKAAHDSLNYTYTYPEFAPTIEQAVLQSPEVQALRKDKERLDFIEEQYGADIVCFESGEWEISSNDIIGFGSDLRDTIDSAMERQI